MAIRKVESWGWCAAGYNQLNHNRWNLNTGGLFNLSSPGRRPGSNYQQQNGMGHVFDNQQTWIVHVAVKFNWGGNFITWSDSGNSQTYINTDSAVGTLRCYRGDGTLLATSRTGIQLNIWHHLIWRVFIGNAGIGQTELRLDGESLWNLTVDNQQTANAYANRINFGSDSFMDVVICDGTGAAPYNGIIGDMAVYCVIPNGAGGSTTWTPSTGSNFQNVDDATPDSDTTYNATSTPGAVDRYAIPTPTLTGSCRGVCVGASVRKDDAGVRTARVKVFDGTAEQPGSTVNLADNYVVLDHIWQTNPTSGTHWTAAELAAAEPGIELIS